MKKTMILAAFAALVSLASCQKEEAINNGTDKNASPVFTASIAGATKTTIDMTDGNVAKIAWETTDEITVTDAASALAVYEIESIDGDTGKATFVYKSGAILGAGPYTASYGTEPATAQTYSATAGKLYMTAPETSNNSFTFTVQCGLMKLNLTKTGESVKSIAVTGTPTGGSETTYTLTCTEAQSIATAKDFFIALPAGSYTKIEITNDSDIQCTLNSASGVTVAANHIKPVTFGDSKINFDSKPLPGKFKVDITGKEVRFSKGNLRYTIASGKWSFFDNQYDCGPSSYNSGHNSEISLFTWGYNATKSIVPNGSASDNVSRTSGNLTQEEDWGSQIGDGSTWRTLTHAEWQYLFSRYNNKHGVTVCGKSNCVVIAPESFSGSIEASYDASAWAEAEAAGLVCLPAAGNRLGGSQIISAGSYGSYWTSTSNDATHATCMGFDGYNDVSFSNGYREDGCAVRLVTESK